ncbi:MAG: hypothetical protein D6741_15620, partial [Planctomycetota bacterium]
MKNVVRLPHPARRWQLVVLSRPVSLPILLVTVALVQQAAHGGARPAQQPHPAVARIIAVERNGASLGSGTLVAVSEHHGLVITNWHVVRDAEGTILVKFPCGFVSPATVMKVDKDWDLAALAIWKPPVDPVPIAVEAPKPGDPLAIAGYGSGNYRMAFGRCTQYVAPSMHHPFEMVELDTTARQGDSGGPIFNAKGELAGVLFGSGNRETMGSYCGRVRWFLADLKDPFYNLPPPPAGMLASAPGQTVGEPVRQPTPPSASIAPAREVNERQADSPKYANVAAEAAPSVGGAIGRASDESPSWSPIGTVMNSSHDARRTRQSLTSSTDSESTEPVSGSPALPVASLSRPNSAASAKVGSSAPNWSQVLTPSRVATGSAGVSE